MVDGKPVRNQCAPRGRGIDVPSLLISAASNQIATDPLPYKQKDLGNPLLKKPEWELLPRDLFLYPHRQDEPQKA